MITTLLAHHGGLARGALAFLLTREPDIEVVAEADNDPDVERAILADRPDLAIIDLDVTTPAGLPVACTLHQRHPDLRMLVLAGAHRLGALAHALAAGRSVGVLAKDGTPDKLVAAVRSLAGGKPVRDPDLTRAIARAGSALTHREREVLWVAANGAPVREIAEALCLSSGTVQNHLSRIIGKTGSRSRVEAVNVARHAGWI